MVADNVVLIESSLTTWTLMPPINALFNAFVAESMATGGNGCFY